MSVIRGRAIGWFQWVFYTSETTDVSPIIFIDIFARRTVYSLSPYTLTSTTKLRRTATLAN